MAGMFDDLIPQQPTATGATASGGMFDDLIPQQNVNGVTQGVTAPLRIQMGNPPSDGGQPVPQQSIDQPGAKDVYTQPSGYVDAAIQGVPIVGPLLQKAGAATAAALHPILPSVGEDGNSFADRYGANLDLMRGRTQQFAGEHPIGSTIAGLAGGVAATAPLMGIPAVADTIGFGGGSLLANTAKGIGSGAVVGGADAALRGGDIPTGATWGAAFGGAAPATGKVIGRAVNAVSNRISPPDYGTNAAQKAAAGIVSEPLKAAGLNSSQAVEDALTKIGPESVLADLDPRLTQMAGTIAGTPGPGQQVIRNALEPRNQTAGSRIVGTMNDVLGKPINLAETGKQIYTAGKTASAPLWDQAYKVPIQSTPELQQALATPAGQTAIRKAGILAANDPNGAQSIMFSKQPVTPATPVTALPDWAQAALQNGSYAADSIRAQFPNLGAASDSGNVDVRGLHLIRQAFDDMIYRSKNPTTSAGKNALGGLMRNRAVVDSALKQVEPMAQADKIFASQAQVNDAMAEGLNIFKGGTNAQMPEDVAALVNGMSDAEKQAYLQGVRVAARKLMGTARNAPLAARNTLQTEFNQEKLAAALGPDEASKILGRISAETTFANTDQRVLRNSETYARAAGKEALQSGAHGFPDLMSTINYSKVEAIPRHLALKGVNSVLSAAKTGQERAIYAEVAKLLSLGRNDRAPILQTLYQESMRRDPSGRLTRIVMPIALQRATSSNNETGTSP